MLLSSQNYIEKGFLYKVLNLWLGTGLVTSGGEKWRSRRKALTPAFHFKIVDQFVQVFNSCGDVFVQQLRKQADDTVFNVYPFAELLTLDVICGRRRRIAFLDLLLWNSRDGSLSDADIREEVDTFMFAGHDTTASALSFTMLLLSRHMDAQNNILKELESVFDPEQPLELTLQKLSELKYLEMVVKESLRIYPPVPVFNRDNPQETALPSGHVMPGGCSITLSPYGTHRDPEVFPEPERFIPERFSPEESARRHPYAYIPFSAGPRNCIGQRFAMMELKSVLAKVVWNFRLLPAPDFEPELSWELTLQSANGIHLRLQDRKLNEL